MWLHVCTYIPNRIVARQIGGGLNQREPRYRERTRHSAESNGRRITFEHYPGEKALPGAVSTNLSLLTIAVPVAERGPTKLSPLQPLAIDVHLRFPISPLIPLQSSPSLKLKHKTYSLSRYIIHTYPDNVIILSSAYARLANT